MRIQNTHIFIFSILDYDCSDLPSIYEKFERGCRGAVYEDGSPSHDICSGSENTWYEKCCKWENERCRPIAPSDSK